MFLYLLAVTGIMISVHYCGQELESWKVYQSSEGCGGDDCTGKEGIGHSCCKDKVITAKVEEDQHHVDALKLKLSADQGILTQVLVFPEWLEPVPAVSQEEGGNRANAPPGLWQQLPLYKLYTRFTYYG